MSNAVVIMTSNLGTDVIQRYDESRRAQMLEEVQGVLASFFRPEFLNRVDDVIVFHRLGREQMERIVPIQLRELRRRLRERGLALEVSDEAVAWLAERGFDPKFGARPLRRLIQTQVVDPLATALIEAADEQARTARVEVEGGELSARLMA